MHLRAFSFLRRWLISAVLLISLTLPPSGAVALAAGPPPQAGPPAGAGPPEMVEVIVQGFDLPAAAAAVHGKGGKVTHQLGIINAVGAKIPAPALEALERAPGVRRIFENRTIEIAAAGGGLTVSDAFNSFSFDGSDGTFGWYSDWEELNETDGPAQGTVNVISSWDCPSDNQCLSIGRDVTPKDGYGVSRRVDLSGATWATLSFDYVRQDFWGYYLELRAQVKGNGQDWITLATIGSGDDGYAHDSDALTIPTDRLAADTQIRFILVDDLFWSAYPYGAILIDNVQVVFEGGSETARDEFNASSFGNDDGSVSWGGDWIENDPEYGGAGPADGKVRILEGGLRLDDQPDTGGAPSAARQIDMSDAFGPATFSFDFHTTSGVDPTDEIAVEVSADGGATFTVLETISGIYGTTWGARSYDISAFASDKTVIRFRVANRYGGRGEYFFADNVQIEYGVYHPDSVFPTLIGADQLHAQGIDGSGVTVAVLDTGYWSHPALEHDANGQERVLARYDAIADQIESPGTDSDDCGHGSHVTSLILSSRRTTRGKFNGVAPNAGLVSVKAFGADGSANYMDVIRAVDWVVSNKDAYNIRVLNLSFSAPPKSFYWDDPLNQAIMRAWGAGIVVVAAAGNTGPDPMTVGVPGNVPYVITAGAYSDNYTPEDLTDDFLTSFSSSGPTAEGFVKPEVVAPGAHMLGLMPGDARFALDHPETYTGNGSYFTMAGTSQAAAVTSGVVALMLQADPNLTPDDVKCRLMTAARPALDEGGALAYSIFQQGAGLVNAYDAALGSTASGCANQGMNIRNDLEGIEHYGGRANQDADGDYYIMDIDGYVWSGAYAWSDGYVWSQAYVWSDSYAWSQAYAWSESYAWSDAYAWSNAYVWSGGYVWSGSGWVPE